mgnify:CR=1 FL=1
MQKGIGDSARDQAEAGGLGKRACISKIGARRTLAMARVYVRMIVVKPFYVRTLQASILRVGK